MPNKITTWNEKQATKLYELVTPQDNKLNKIIAEIATTDKTTNVYWSGIQRDIKKVYRELIKKTNTWTIITIPKGYNLSARTSIFKIKSKKIRAIQEPVTILPFQQSLNYTSFINSNVSRQTIQALIQETITSYTTGYLTGEKLILRLARITQQVNVAEDIIARQIEDGFIESGSIQGSLKRLQSELMRKAIDGKYITVIDKNGKPISYQVKSYAELVARTKLQETSTDAVLNTADAAGSDLVQVSSHNTKSEICIPFEGKIFSISGNNKDFPKLNEASPYHPNCQHTMSVVFEEGLEADGTYDKYSDFSKGKTETHPTRKSWIPPSERTGVK